MNNVNQVINKDFFKKLEDVVIMPNTGGGFDMFNRYRITKNRQNDIIIYDLTQEKQYKFNYIKNAFVWCILDKYFYISELRRLQELDIMLASLNVTINQQNKMLPNKNKEDREIMLAKIKENTHKRAIVINECEAMTLKARILQSKKFHQ